MEKRDLIHGYATALFQIAEAEGVLDRVSDELFRFSRAVEQNHELRNALTDIAVPQERKRAVIAELLSDRASPLTVNVLEFVVSQGRARELGEIVSSLAALASEARQHVLAEVRTAVELDDATKRKLAEALGRATGKDVDVKVFVDPAIVGGVYAKVGDQVIDATVRRRLLQLREQLAKAGGSGG